MKLILTSTTWCRWLAAWVLLLTVTSVLAHDGTPKFEIQLIWATNDAESPDTKYKAIDRETRKKLAELPLKWANYYQVARKCPEIAKDATKKVAMSDKCEIEVRNLGESKIEVSLYGNGIAVCKRTQSLAKGEILVLGGNAPNSTAWLVTLKRVD